MFTIGITGPSGCGKSTLRKEIEKIDGSCTIDADEVYHDLLEHDVKLRAEIEAQFKTTDRRRLASIVFSNHKALECLNKITWPRIRSEIVQLLELAEISGARIAAIDAVALFESGLNEYCNTTIAVVTSQFKRVNNIMKRDNVDMQAAWDRIAAQPPIELYKCRCQYTIHNPWLTADEFALEANKLLQEVLSCHPGL